MKKARSSKNNRKSKNNKSFNWKRTLKKLCTAIPFIAVIVIAIMVYGDHRKIEYDLSVIGNGKATVVQIHDPNCQLCRRLKSNLDSVKGRFKNKIQFKTANIAGKKGRDFANSHQVPHVTLLFFDKKGNRVNTLQGVTPKKEIKNALEKLI